MSRFGDVSDDERDARRGAVSAAPSEYRWATLHEAPHHPSGLGLCVEYGVMPTVSTVDDLDALCDHLWPREGDPHSGDRPGDFDLAAATLKPTGEWAVRTHAEHLALRELRGLKSTDCVRRVTIKHFETGAWAQLLAHGYWDVTARYQQAERHQPIVEARRYRVHLVEVCSAGVKGSGLLKDRHSEAIRALVHGLASGEVKWLDVLKAEDCEVTRRAVGPLGPWSFHCEVTKTDMVVPSGR